MAACRSLWSYRAVGAGGNLGIALGLGALGCFLLWQTVPGPWGWILVIGACLIIIMTRLRDRNWRQYYRDAPKYSGPINAQFSDDTVCVQSGEGRSELPWSHFKTFLRTEHAFFLIVDQRQFSIIPITAFQDANDANQFEALLAEKLKRLPRRYL